MASDYYSILGVTPASEDVVIRAAYRALMRRYHPDTDPTREALQKVQAINAAYAVLSDPEKRARYDGSLAAQQLIRPDAPRRRPVARFFPRPGPAAAIGFAALAAAMVAIAAWQPVALPLPALRVGGEQQRARTIETRARAPAQTGASLETADICGNAAASDLIRDEIFRRAAGIAASNPALARIASLASIRIESPTSRTSPAGAAGCHGFVALDLPPGLVVDGGRTNLTAEIAYGLVEGSGGGVRLTGLSGANGIVRSLATLAPEHRETMPVVEPIAPPQVALSQPPPASLRTEATARSKPSKAVEKPSKAVEKPIEKAAESKLASASVPSTAAASKPAEPANKASFNCKIANSAAEKAICGSSNLSALDRQAALLYRQSWGQANETKRSALLLSRVTFVEKRNKCAGESCLTSAYVARIREISDIMAGRREP